MLKNILKNIFKYLFETENDFIRTDVNSFEPYTIANIKIIDPNINNGKFSVYF